jgi:radical SAM superfamily enzyme YgiQ (UPF0313 family)
LKPENPEARLLAAEIGTVRKNWRGKTTVALVYPNRYCVGMSNLGLQAVYDLLNRREDVVCERAFLPEDDGAAAGRLTTLESGRPAAEADIVAFSLSFENDYPNLLDLLALAGLPLRAGERGPQHPLVIAGGVACSLNPEPIAAFFDCILIGEAEVALPRFLDAFSPRGDRQAFLREAARSVPGAYVPVFYRTEYHPDGTIASFSPGADVPARVGRPFLKDLSPSPTCSRVVSPDTAFGRSFLVEVSRGCPHGCRFCGAGFVYRPPRFRSAESLEETIRGGLVHGGRIGLVGAAVSDLPGLGALCARFGGTNAVFSFSSLRADALTPELAAALKRSRVKTATIAPEAGSERLRRVISKGLDEEAVLQAAETLVSQGIPNLKMYFMIGLPTETPADVAAVVDLVKKVKHRFLQASRGRKSIGTITVSVNCFVPKPFTPFQWAAMDEVAVLKSKLKSIQTALQRVPNVRVHADVPRWAFIQALLSRGDRRTAEILAAVHAHGGNWPQSLKTTALNPGFYATRERRFEEILPWDFIDHRVEKSFLWQEWQRALAGRPGGVCRPETCRLCGACGVENEK